MAFSDEEGETVRENVPDYEILADSDENGDKGTDENVCYDHMCAICDNGGPYACLQHTDPNLLLSCDGKCMRSFHTTIQDDGSFYCESLGFTDEELQEIQDVPFICENCKYKVHQCFACGRLGSSDESSPEVFCCVNGTCGFFFHPDCVAKLLCHGDDAGAEELKQRIVSGEPFACPAHTCHVCKEVEVTSIKDLQFAVCRRCPQAYHRKCLPREITSEHDVDLERGILQRVWDGLIPNRLLIYCLDHEIDPDIYTPARGHIKFPGPSRERKNLLPLESRSRERKKELESGSSVKYNLLKERGEALEENAGKKSNFAKPMVFSSLAPGRVKKYPLHMPSKKQKVSTNGNSLGKTNAREIPLGGKLNMDSELAHSSSGGVLHGEYEMRHKVKCPAKRMCNSLTFDDDIRKRILSLMEDASSSVTLDQVKEKHIATSTHVQSKNSFTLGKVEGLVQAIRAAVKKMDGGCSVQEAKAVCGNDLLLQALRWKDKLNVYLAPFLYGMRYTSFGRHFTKPNKLKEIVDILHWYVKDGDMLVDFCCGSNDFSCLMKKKLDQMGKSCSFRNYDILQPKNDFNFERRDWMGVKPNELPDGSKLIMGLNPPFGVKAALANKFINKALEFKPKLLVLIVPRETHRLDKKESTYDLIWENDQMFIGKSFYLPGSIDVHDKQLEDWNINAPVLYLWSCQNWTSKHRAIAEQHHHLSGALQNRSLDDQGRYDSHDPNTAQEYHNLKSFVTPESLEQKDRVTATTRHKDVNVKKRLNKEKSRRSRTSSQAYVPGPSPGYNFTAPADLFMDPFEGRADNFGEPNLLFQRMANHPEFPFGEMGTSAMQRYAPRYNERNDARLGNMVPAQNMSLTYHPCGPSPSSHRPLGFAPAPHPSYSQQFNEMNDARMDNVVRVHPLLAMSSIYHPHGSRPGSSVFAPGPHSFSQRLDEMNDARMGNMVHGHPLLGMSSVYHPHGLRPGYLGFASGPNPSYSQGSNSGWLDE